MSLVWLIVVRHSCCKFFQIPNLSKFDIAQNLKLFQIYLQLPETFKTMKQFYVMSNSPTPCFLSSHFLANWSVKILHNDNNMIVFITPRYTRKCLLPLKTFLKWIFRVICVLMTHRSMKMIFVPLLAGRSSESDKN